MNKKSDTLTLLFTWVAVAWGIFFINTLFCGGNLNDVFGIAPRSIEHLPGIIAMPFLHANVAHLLTNTIMFVILGGLVAWTRRREFGTISLLIIIFSGIGVWLFARGTISILGPETVVHVGASGLLFGYIGYMVTEMVTLRERNIIVGVLAVMIFTSSFSSMFPGGPRNMSWEGHLFGFIAGVLTSFALAKSRK